jgi:hypothetical protein
MAYFLLDPRDDWNPDVENRRCYLASFGLGKQHCPKGTAALFAAYRLLGHFIGTFFDAGMQEQYTDWALNHAYLSPTLSVRGPQHFIIYGSNNDDNNDDEARRLPHRTALGEAQFFAISTVSGSSYFIRSRISRFHSFRFFVVDYKGRDDRYRYYHHYY